MNVGISVLKAIPVLEGSFIKTDLLQILHD